MPSPIASFAEILQKAKEDVSVVPIDNIHEMTRITIVSGLTSLINKLNFMTGNTPANAAPVEQFPPITDFFGEPIIRGKHVVAADLEPSKTVKDIFLGKVDALQATIRDRRPETLIQDFSQEPDVLRGVAIRAGLEDAKDGLINIDFIERIKEGLDAKDQRAKEEDEINQELAGESKLTEAGEVNLTDVSNVVNSGKTSGRKK